MLKKNNYTDIEKGAKGAINLLLSSFNIVVYLFFFSLLLFGCAASLVLLYKMYPELGTQFLEGIFMVSRSFIFILKVIIVFFIISLTVWTCAIVVSVFNISKQNRIKKREKFLDDLALRLTARGIKKVSNKKKARKENVPS